MSFTKCFLFVALAASINCSNSSDTNQANAVSQNISDGGTASSSAENTNSETQIAAPDTIVKELFKLHNADKSPIYKAKNRAEMEKFFSKDFVNLVWTSGSEPNLMNKLAIEGDVLTGLDGLSKFESENVGKAEFNGTKTIVPVTINAADEDKKKFKTNLNYELIKENSGWRIADIKYNGFYSDSLVATINNFQKSAKDFEKELNEEFRSDKPPFAGKRWFNTEKEASGTGTPQYYLKINENNYAFCGFVQTNQASGEVTEEEIPLGKFKNIFDCNFKNELGGKNSYQIKNGFIYGLDKNKKIIEASKSEFYAGN